MLSAVSRHPSKQTLDARRPRYQGWQQYDPWQSNTTLCESNNNDNDKPRPPFDPLRAQPSPNNPYKTEIEQLQKELDEPCSVCMYTGVATCVGLSLYFVKLATEEGAKHRRFLWGCSAASLVAGGVRFYLG